MTESNPESSRIIELKDDHRYSVFGLFVWIAVMFLFPVFGSTVGVTSILMGTVFCIGAWSTGILLLHKVDSINYLFGIVKDGIAILLGSIVIFAVLWLLSGNPGGIALYAITLLPLLAVVLLKRVALLCIDISSILGVIVILIYYLVQSNQDLVRSMSADPLHFVSDYWDPVFFTAVIASMREGSMNAIYEVGSPIGYQSGSFLAPASFSAFTEISSAVSLWGCWMPFYKVLGLLTVSEFVLKIASVRNSIWIKSIIILMFFFLAPLHPEYILKFDVGKFIWLGIGYLIPGGNIAFTGSYAWIGIIGIILLGGKEMKYNISSSLLLIALIGSLILVKLPMFFVIGVFVGVIALFQLKYKNFQPLVISFLSLVFALIIYKFNYQEDSMREVAFMFGYLPLTYAKLAGVQGMAWGFLVVAATILIWGGIRFLGLGLLFKFNKKASYLRFSISFAVFVSLLGTIVVASIFSILYFDTDGTLLDDGTFDLEQFIRAAFGLISVVSIAGFIILFYGDHKIRLRKLAVVVCIVWCSLALMSTIYRTPDLEMADDSWYEQTKKELLILKPDLATINPSRVYSGQQLVAADLGSFWVTTMRDEGGHNLSNINSWRWRVMEACLSSDPADQVQAYQSLIENHVDVIIASPETKDQLESFAVTNKLKLPPSFSWVYPLQPGK